MPRRLRFISQPDTLVEVTYRTIQGRMLLRPCRLLNESIIGVISRGQRRFGVQVCAVVVLSTHLHLLLRVDDARQLARFMELIGSKIAREVGRLADWKDKIWARRYAAIEVDSEPVAQIARLRYLLSQGVKENLVARCSDWPGVHCAEALMTGRPLAGYWFDRTREGRARASGSATDPYAYAEEESLVLGPLPCWQHLDNSSYRHRVIELVAEVEAEAASERRRRGVKPLGIKAIKRQDPHATAEQLERSPAPAFHAATREARRVLVEAYRWFEAAYRAAAKRLRSGDRNVLFPEGCFPPRLPFVAPLGQSP